MLPGPMEHHALNIDWLTVENRTDRISFYGSIDITRDQAGLVHAQRLKDLFEAIVAVMQAEPLPATISIKPAEEIDNPFA